MLVYTTIILFLCTLTYSYSNTFSYFHRVARAGRFGTKGLAISFVSDEDDAKVLNDVQDRFEVNVSELPVEIDVSTYIEGYEAQR